MVEVAPSWFEFGGGVNCLIGRVKLVWTSDSYARHDKDDYDELGAGELFDVLIELLGGRVLVFLSYLFLSF